MFAGRITVETREIIARTMGEFENLAEIENLVVTRGRNGEPVFLRDLARVEDSHEEMRVNTRFNGGPCVKLSVLKQAEANTVKISQSVQQRISELESEIPEDISLGVVENQGDYVMAAIKSVESSALLAALLVILVVYLFLGRWRQVAVMGVALPVTLLVNFFLMKVAGFSINLFSLGGLVVALGVILDNSIVVLENMTRLKAEGKPDWALAGITEVGPAIVAATLTFLALFLPFLFVPGLAALLFKELVLVVAGIVVVSLLVAVTLTPVLTSRLLGGDHSEQSSRIARLFDNVIGKVTRHYEGLLSLTLGWRKTVVAVTILVFCLGLVLAAWTGSEFLPKVDDGRVMVMDTDRALAYWKNFTARYDSTVPPDYKNHPDWNGAMKNIEKSISEMKRAKDAKTALTACGRTWGHFMELNEKVGIVMTADILYKFRKAAKPLLNPVKTKNFAAIMPSADTLTTLRERAIGLSVSEKNASAPEISDLKQFSDALDAFIHAAQAKDAENIDTRYQTMMSSMEKAYDRFL